MQNNYYQQGFNDGLEMGLCFAKWYAEAKVFKDSDTLNMSVKEAYLYWNAYIVNKPTDDLLRSPLFQEAGTM